MKSILKAHEKTLPDIASRDVRQPAPTLQDELRTKGNLKKKQRVGSKKALGSFFYFDLLEHWKEHGPAAIAAVYKDSPSTYLKCVAAVLPRDLNVNVNIYDGLTTDELRAQLLDLQAAAREFDRANRAPAKLELEGTAEPTPNLPAIPETDRLS